MSEWSTADPALLSDTAPHELSAVMRWHRAKVPSKQIMELLRLRGTQLIAALEKAKKDESAAVGRGLDIHQELMPKEVKGD